MGKRYVAISETEMVALLVDKLGFEDVTHRVNANERVFERQIISKSGVEFPYAVRVYSTIECGGSRGCGEDAIRVNLIDLKEENPKFRFKKVLGEDKGKKAGRSIYRTKSAMINLETRIENYIWHVVFKENHCPKCGGLTAIRENKNTHEQFLSCDSWHTTKCGGTKAIVITFDEWRKERQKKKEAA